MSVSQEQDIFARFDISKGVNSRYPKVGLGPDEIVDGFNVHLRPRGGAVVRKGIKKVRSADSADNRAVNGLYYFVSDTTDALIRVKDGKIEYLSAFGGWVDRTQATGAAANTVSNDPDTPIQFETFKEHVILTDGENAILKWDGGNGFAPLDVTLSAGQEMIRAKCVVKHKERLIFGDVTYDDAGVITHFPSRIVATVAATLESWNTTATGHRIDIGEGDGDAITALLDVKGVLLVWKQGSLWKITNYGLSGAQDTLKVADVGCAGPHCVVAVGTRAYFLDKEGQLWSFQIHGQDEDALINHSVDRFGEPVLDNIVKDRLPQAKLEYDSEWGEVLCLITMNGGTQNNIAWVYNVVTDGFTRMGWVKDLCSLTTAKDADGVIRLVAGSYDGIVYQLETSYGDDGSDIEWVVITRADAFDNAALIKRLAEIHVYCRVNQSTDFTIESRNNFKESGAQWTKTATPPGDDSDPAGSGTGGTPSGDTSVNAAPNIAGETPNIKPPDGPNPNDPTTSVATNTITLTPNLLEADTTRGRIYTVRKTAANNYKLSALDALNHSETWNTAQLSNFTDAATAQGIKYVEANDQVWVWNNRYIYVINASTGVVVTTLDITTYVVSGGGFFNSISGNNAFVDGQRFIISAKDDEQGGIVDFAFLVIDIDSYAKLGESAFGTTSALYVVAKIGGRYYWLDSTHMVSGTAGDSPGTGSIDTDHGAFDGSTYGVGWDTSPGLKLIYDPDRAFFYKIGVETGMRFLVAKAGIIQHPDGTPHSPAHDYHPSNNDPGTAFGAYAAVDTYEFHRSRGQIYAVLDDSLVRATPGTTMTGAPVVLDTVSLSAGSWQFMVYVPSDGVMVMLNSTNNELRTYS